MNENTKCYKSMETNENELNETWIKQMEMELNANRITIIKMEMEINENHISLIKMEINGKYQTRLWPKCVVFSHDFRVFDDPPQLGHHRLVHVRLLPEIQKKVLYQKHKKLI